MLADVDMSLCSFDGEMSTYGGEPGTPEEIEYGVAAYVFRINEPESYE